VWSKSKVANVRGSDSVNGNKSEYKTWAIVLGLKYEVIVFHNAILLTLWTFNNYIAKESVKVQFHVEIDVYHDAKRPTQFSSYSNITTS
jgi:hypothetical protein